MTIIFFILSCILVGLISRFFYPGKVPMSWLGTLGIGVGASIIGTLFGALVGIKSIGLIGSILAGVLVIWLWKKYKD